MSDDWTPNQFREDWIARRAEELAETLPAGTFDSISLKEQASLLLRESPEGDLLARYKDLLQDWENRRISQAISVFQDLLTDSELITLLDKKRPVLMDHLRSLLAATK